MAQRTEMLMKNMEFVGYDDLNKKPGFQMAMQKANGKYYLYASCYSSNGVNILDVTDPYHPRKVKWLEGPWPDENIRSGQLVCKIQVADGLMLTAHEPAMPILQGNRGDEPGFGALMIWDVKTDPEDPKPLSRIDFHGQGVHRFFYNGGDYAYLTATEDGYNVFILQIVDLHDPKNPVIVSKWAVPGQEMEPGHVLNPVTDIQLPMIHAVMVKNDIAYVAAPNYGFTLLDVSDKKKPKEIGRLPINDAFGGGMQGTAVHTAMPLGDTRYAIVTSEGERPTNFSEEWGAFGTGMDCFSFKMNMFGVADVEDMDMPTLISMCPYPEVPEGYTHGKNFNFVDGIRVPFGPHNMFDAFGPDVYEKRNDRIYNAYFQAGLRAYDVSDPFMPKEIAYFMPPDPKERLVKSENGRTAADPLVAVTEDVLVDDRGYIYVDTFNDGVYIVKCTV